MIEIREMQSQDLATLSQIYFEVRQAAFDWASPTIFKIEDFEEDVKGELVLVAQLESKVVGFISLWTQDNFIHHLFVLPSYQRAGVGQELLASGLERIGRPARLKCVVYNLKACQFYERRGWRIEGLTNDGLVDPYYNFVL